MNVRQVRWRTFDAALAGVLTVAAVVEITIGGYSPITSAFAAIVTVALNWRRSYPLAVMVVSSCAWTVPIMFGLVPSEAALTPLVALLIAVYSVARHGPTRGAIAGAAVALATSLASDLRMADPGPGDFGFTAILISWPWFAGYALRGRELANAALAHRARLLEAERDAKAQAAVTEERARIARELHDIISHSVSVMVIQAGAAEQIVPRDPVRAASAMAAIADTGRDALVDLRRLLGLLRRSEMPPVLAPRPGIADLDTLVGQVRSAGLPVTFRVDGEPTAVPPGVDLTAYRIVQEALTNTLKHAGPATADVAVHIDPDAVRVTITDTGNPSVVAGVGHGLTGMRERVSLYGGDLDAGPAPRGGYRVIARLPLQGSR